MANLTRKAVIRAVEEATYGTDPGTGLLGILSTVPDVGFEGEEITRDFSRDTLSPIGSGVGAKKQTLSFETELKGANDDLDPTKEPNWACLLRACWMQQETLVAGGPGGIDVLQWSPSSTTSDQKSVTLYFHADGILHKLVGCRGTVSWDFPVGQYPKMKFNFTGLWADPTDTTFPTDVVFEEHNPPLVVSAGLLIDSAPPNCVETISLDLGNEVVDKKCVNHTDGLPEIYISGRKPSGSIDPDVEPLATFNPFNIWQTAGKIPISWGIGSDLGNRVYMNVPKAQIGGLSYQDKNGRRAYNAPISPTGDDDEIVLQVG